ncbi:FxsB family cyclophane-forming radical SAM/SPASM peptide maturase [Planosporangium sp. 12N6]|uniref:FxsB family cyclophane-forming radical SAM/SPASM peptide maturase n=1 Tax=Planosporangium spinosum TaxID=3402278 RepID=UPI003CF169C0
MPLAATPIGDTAQPGVAVTPFTQFVVKTTAKCNFACDYCYMYEAADRSWRDLAAAMSDDTMAQVARRIAEHAERHGLKRIQIVFHGGEPLLSGPDTLARAADLFRREVGPGTAVECTVQTNGALLTERCVETLAGADIRVGVSLDGDRGANDRHRRLRGGRSSHETVVRGLRALRAHPEIYAGILCVVDLANPPVETYESLLEHRPPMMDFLLPHGNWTTPPPGRPPDASTPYADWAIAVFDRWYGAPRVETGVRLFEEIISGLLGGASRSESVGLSPVAVIVVNVDGALEQVDTLRTAYHGAVSTALNVFDHPLDDALRHRDVVARQSGLRALSETCLRCPVHRVCGGGYYPHRYRAGSGFRNPSVYCPDLFRLIGHIRDRVRADVATIARRTT